MENNEIHTVLNGALELQNIIVDGDGKHIEVIAVDECFASLSRLKKQQLIYAPLTPFIQSGEIHAVSIKTYTPEEWERDKKLMNL